MLSSCGCPPWCAWAGASRNGSESGAVCTPHRSAVARRAARGGDRSRIRRASEQVAVLARLVANLALNVGHALWNKEFEISWTKEYAEASCDVFVYVRSENGGGARARVRVACGEVVAANEKSRSSAKRAERPESCLYSVSARSNTEKVMDEHDTVMRRLLEVERAFRSIKRDIRNKVWRNVA